MASPRAGLPDTGEWAPISDQSAVSSNQSALIGKQVRGFGFMDRGGAPAAERVSLLHHPVEHATDLLQFAYQHPLLFCFQVTTGGRHEDPVLCFKSFSIPIRKLGYEVAFVSSLAPRLGYLAADRPRRPPDLVHQGVRPLSRKRLGEFEDPLSHASCLLIDHQFAKAAHVRQAARLSH